MKRSHIAIIATGAAALIALVAWGTIAGAVEVMGIVTAKGAAEIVAVDQPDAEGTVVIAKVVAPADSWVVIHQSDGGMPGKRLGMTRVEKGVTRDVEVKLDAKVPLTPELLAAVHADRGTSGEFEFDMEDTDRSPDRPYFVDGKEVATAFKAAEFGVPVKMDEASIESGDQMLGDSVTVAKAVAPSDAFVVVHKAKPDGMPGERVGYAPIKAGESTNVKVKLTKKLTGTVKLLAAIHADRGEAGKLEFDMERPVTSPDQPFFSDGMEVAAGFKVGPFGVKAERASVEATDQIGAEDELVVAKVVSPTDAWVVVHKDAGGGTPGMRVGLKRVKAGTSTDVKVELMGAPTEQLLVALHADRGTSERFDFDMDDKLGSTDQPFFVDGEEVAVAVKVREFGVKAEMGMALVEAAPQAVRNATVSVGRVLAPTPSWVVVHLDAGGGMPGKRVGLAWVPAGESRGVVVQLDASKKLTDTLLAAVHADRGEPGVFEFDMMDRTGKADQPFFVGDMEVAAGIEIR